ncbi:adenylate/guanylate cyclase domain-containing protein [Maricaulis sp.]|uniref:adenylate/guanylate cyclase domain-containing protein n=1 Tax=Maricaulis sp. TaxID=1486257 RepID=UPI000C4FED15|nr:adenylate/guanylate cyclase domain-containing protein [Maricaulis sp.]MAC90082.1 adenylate cyclase [Maricaulis sp.]
MRDRIIDRFNQGDLARAYDLCQEGLLGQPDDYWLKHRAVLCLIRSGALERAAKAYQDYQLETIRHDEDCLAVGARLLKALALESSGRAFARLALESAEKYADVHARTGGHYPAVNAASMYMLAGRSSDAETYARRVLYGDFDTVSDTPEQGYYRYASQAEAYLLIGDLHSARTTLREAFRQDPANYLAHATTLRQLRLLVSVLGLDSEWLAPLEPPRPAHFAGHIFGVGEAAGLVEPRQEDRLRETVDLLLARHHVGPVYGALAAGSDIVVAEAALARGCELNLILPVPVPVFLDASVRPFGEAWVSRFETCLRQAEKVVELTTDRRIASPEALNFSSLVAMGMARMRANVLATTPLQLLVADDDQAEVAPAFGTHHDSHVWTACGLDQVRVRYPGTRCAGTSQAKAGRVLEPGFRAVMRAMLFLDIAGSSSVPDDRVPHFVQSVLKPLAECCDRLAAPAVHADSWGDGMFLAFETVEQAAIAADALRQVFAAIDLRAHDLPPSVGLRIAGHFGPVHVGEDPLQKRPSLFGGQVAVAARIEAVTVPGSVFVSEAFAAALAMSSTGFRSEYVGHIRIDALMPEQRLYSLRAMARDAVVGLQVRASARSAQAI